MLANLITAGLFTFAFPEELRIDYGKVRFGTERPLLVGKANGLRFRICDTAVEGDQVRVFGVATHKARQAVDVLTATTADGITFTNERLVYRLPKPDNQWLAADLVMANDQLLLMVCDYGRPAKEGHRFHLFSGNPDGTGWAHRNDQPIYKGQDAFGIVWDEESQRLINYQTTYQKWPKRYADNMGKCVRRVLHIRTSPNGLDWTPGGSFGVVGPYLPEDQLIVPDEQDPGETEFYKFRPARFGDFWAGSVVKYVPQPAGLPRSGTLPHGPFLSCEWWVSRDGFRWDRPFRETSDFEGVNFKFSHCFHPPIFVAGEYRWLADRDVYALRPDRMFFVESRANAELTTPVINVTRQGLSLQVSFESVRLKRKSHLVQGYLMAELRTADDVPIPGFEKDKCRFLPSAETSLPLAWDGGRLPSPLPKGGLRLKLYFRDLRIYSLLY